MVGELDVAERRVDVEEADADVRLLGLARERDHAGGGEIPREDDDVVAAAGARVVDDRLSGDREVRDEALAAGEHDDDVVQRQVKAGGGR